VSPPPKLAGGYGVDGGATMAWFSLVAVFFTREDVRRKFQATDTGSIAAGVVFWRLR